MKKSNQLRNAVQIFQYQFWFLFNWLFFLSDRLVSFSFAEGLHSIDKLTMDCYTNVTNLTVTLIRPILNRSSEKIKCHNIDNCSSVLQSFFKNGPEKWPIVINSSASQTSKPVLTPALTVDCSLVPNKSMIKATGPLTFVALVNMDHFLRVV